MQNLSSSDEVPLRKSFTFFSDHDSSDSSSDEEDWDAFHTLMCPIPKMEYLERREAPRHKGEALVVHEAPFLCLRGVLHTSQAFCDEFRRVGGDSLAVFSLKKGASHVVVHCTEASFRNKRDTVRRGMTFWEMAPEDQALYSRVLHAFAQPILFKNLPYHHKKVFTLVQAEQQALSNFAIKRALDPDMNLNAEAANVANSFTVSNRKGLLSVQSVCEEGFLWVERGQGYTFIQTPVESSPEGVILGLTQARAPAEAIIPFGGSFVFIEGLKTVVARAQVFVLDSSILAIGTIPFEGALGFEEKGGVIYDAFCTTFDSAFLSACPMGAGIFHCVMGYREGEARLRVSILDSQPCIPWGRVTPEVFTWDELREASTLSPLLRVVL